MVKQNISSILLLILANVAELSGRISIEAYILSSEQLLDFIQNRDKPVEMTLWLFAGYLLLVKCVVIILLVNRPAICLI